MLKSPYLTLSGACYFPRYVTLRFHKQTWRYFFLLIWSLVSEEDMEVETLNSLFSFILMTLLRIFSHLKKMQRVESRFL